MPGRGLGDVLDLERSWDVCVRDPHICDVLRQLHYVVDDVVDDVIVCGHV